MRFLNTSVLIEHHGFLARIKGQMYLEVSIPEESQGLVGLGILLRPSAVLGMTPLRPTMLRLLLCISEYTQ